MRKTTMALCAVVLVMPAMAQEPFRLPDVFPAQDGFPLTKPAFPLTPGNAAAAVPGKLIIGRAGSCYYIRQVNTNMQKPLAKPVLVPLAAEGADQNPSGAHCTPDLLLNRAIAR